VKKSTVILAAAALAAVPIVWAAAPARRPEPTHQAASATPKPTPVPAPSPAAVTGPIELKSVENNAFKSGEKLEFVIKYEFVAGGTATMEVSDGPLIGGRPTLNVQSKAESNSVIDKVFKVRDFNGAAIDKASLVSLHFHQNLKEGGYHVVRNTAFDYMNASYNWEKIYKGKTTQRTGRLEKPMQDILSAFFVTRTMPLELGKKYSITVFSDEDVYPLWVKVGDKTESVSVDAGKFDCIRVEPSFQGDAIFKAREGRMVIWLTNDARHMPVLIRSKIAVGAFDAELTRFKN
jgi:hypothetical protein